MRKNDRDVDLEFRSSQKAGNDLEKCAGFGDYT